MKGRLVNTAEVVAQHPILSVALALSGQVERLRRLGQGQLVDCGSVLPAAMTAGTRERLEAAGVLFGELMPEDALFRRATLPDGWVLAPDANPLCSRLMDEAGTVRALVHYDAAFYARRAAMHAL